MSEARYRIHQAGDTALVVEFGHEIAADISQLVLSYSDQIDALALPGIVETVPTFRSLMVHYDPDVVSNDELAAQIAGLSPAPSSQQATGRLWHIPVCYDEALGLDLAQVASDLGLSPKQLVELHTSQAYHVFMLGFLPGQPYLGELPPALRLPRRQTPRLKIPAGSVAIATSLTCIFPAQTPCGWHVLGRTPVAMWNMQESGRPLMEPGDRVQFAPQTSAEFDDLARRVGDRSFRHSPSYGDGGCTLH